jgi:hypothetical protein
MEPARSAAVYPQKLQQKAMMIGSNALVIGNLRMGCFYIVFWPSLGVGGKIQILEIRQYSSGLNFASALTLSQNPNLEIAHS